MNPQKMARCLRVLALYRAGWTYAQIADELGVTKGRVQQLIRTGRGIEEHADYYRKAWSA